MGRKTGIGRVRLHDPVFYMRINCTGLRVAGVVLALILLSSLPLVFVSFPPLMDYPFHLARMFILSHLNHAGVAGEVYEFNTYMLPNIGIDLIGLLLAKVMSPELTGLTFVFLIFVLLISGTAFLSYAIYKKVSLGNLLIASILCYNWILFLGFLNYLFGIGVLLWYAGLWKMMQNLPAWKRVILGNLLSITLFFTHLIAFGIFALVLTGLELGRWIDFKKIGVRPLLKDWFVLPAVFIIPVAIYIGISPTSGDLGSALSFQPTTQKFINFFRTFTGGNIILDVATGVLVLVAAVVFARRLKISVDRQFACAIVVLFLAYICLPVGTSAGWYLDDRIPLALSFLVAGSIRFHFFNKRSQQIFTGIIASLLLIRIAITAMDWNQYQNVYHPLLNTFRVVETASILFVVEEKNDSSRYEEYYGMWRPPTRHMGELAVITGKVFAPSVFAHPELQPIIMKEKYKYISDFQKNDPIPFTGTSQLDSILSEIRELHAGVAETFPDVYVLILKGQELKDHGIQAENVQVILDRRIYSLVRLI